MANHIVKRGKLFVDIFYRPDIQRQFELHRNIKSHLSYETAQKFVQENEQLYLTYGKTAFLQFWNNFPLFFPFHFYNYQLPIHLDKMKNLTVYQQQLRLAIFYKMKDYMQIKQEKYKLSDRIKLQQKRIIEQTKVRPYDIINASTFLFFQKDSTMNEIFLHCIEIFKTSNYNSLLPVFPRITPMIIRRLTLSDWNIIRQFQNYINFIVYDFKPGEVAIKINVTSLYHISMLQLHLIGYQTIPKFIDLVFAQVCRNLERQNNLDVALIQSVFQNFKYLPINYNQKAYRLIFKRLLQKIRERRELFFADKLPYIRMTNEQVKQFYDAAFQNGSIMSVIHYIGNKQYVRHWLKQMNYMPQLLKQFKSFHPMTFKQFVLQTITCTILINHYHNNETELALIKKHYIKRAEQFQSKVVVTRHNTKTISLVNIFHLYLLEQICSIKIRLNAEGLFNEFQKRQSELQSLSFFDMVDEAIQLYYNTTNKMIIDWINLLITRIAMASKKFNFKYFTSFILALIKSDQSSAYDKTIKLLFSRLKDTDTPFFIELYNRYPAKTMKMNMQITGLVWSKHPSFKSIGKLLLSSNYAHYTSPRGQLQRELKTILESIEPGLNLDDIRQFIVPQMISFLRFLRHFKKFLPTFSTKFLRLALTVLEEIDISPFQKKKCITLFQQLAVLQAELGPNEEIRKKTMKYLQKVKLIFKESPLLKVKELQIRWILGLVQNQDRVSLIVSEILDDLSQSNYSARHLDVVLTLLKLYAFEAIQLDPLIRQKLTKISIHSVEDQLIGIGQIINGTHLLTKKGGVMINPKKGEPLANILKRSITLIKGRQNFQFYIHFVEVGRLCQDQELIKLGCKQLRHVKMFPSQIRKILNILKFLPFMQLNDFREKIMNDTFEMSLYLESQLPQILYTVHSLRDETPKHQIQIYNSLFIKCQSYLIDVINGKVKQRARAKTNMSQQQFFILQILKFLWVSIKINNINEKSFILFKYIQTNFNIIRQFPASKQMDGFNWQFIYYIKQYFHKIMKQQLPQSTPQNKKNKLFKSKTINEQSISQGFPQQQFLAKKLKFDQFELKSTVLKKLELHHLKQVKQIEANDSDNCFVCNYPKKGVTLPIWIKKNQKEYGVLILDAKSFNQSNQKRGRVDFMINVMSTITEIPIIAVAPGLSFELK